MRILVTGSRNWTDKVAVRWALMPYRCIPDVTLVHGGAQGADSIAHEIAEVYGFTTEVHRPDYKAYPGHIAPLKRNDAMLDSGIDLVLAFMLGVPEKGGTLYTFTGARKRGLRVVLHNWPGDPEYKA